MTASDHVKIEVRWGGAHQKESLPVRRDKFWRLATDLVVMRPRPVTDMYVMHC